MAVTPSVPSRISAVSRSRKVTTGSFRVVGAAIALGVATGIIVALVQNFVVLMQRAALGFAAERRIAFPDHVSFLRIFLSLAIGALLVAQLSKWFRRKEPEEPIDAVEANALRGGKMTWWDAAVVTIPILISVCCGASVGIEAAVTQLGAVLASEYGQRRALPRSDRRLLVGAGAAAAIAAAYRAPIAGMLYAYELVLGTYSKRTLAPIGLAAIAATMTMWALTGSEKPFSLTLGSTTIWTDYPVALLIGVLSAGTGMVMMLLVTSFERQLKRLIGNDILRRLFVCGIVTILSVRFPAVLGSGHSGIDQGANGHISGGEAAGLLGAKVVTSAASLGGGFRGGLFSASLLIGALLGQVVAWALTFIPGAPAVHPGLCSLVGMASVGASVIGAPLSMIFLTLETTGDFDAAVVVAVGAVAAGFLTDRLFGYSFATWRFQQRGLAIEGGHDVARLTSTAITDLIRPPKRSIKVTSALNETIRAVSTAGGRGTAVLTPDGGFVGLVDPRMVEALAEEDGPLPVVAAELVYGDSPLVTPATTLAETIEIFRIDDRPTLAVVDPTDLRKLIGCVRARDAFALASSLLDEQRRDDLGIPR